MSGSADLLVPWYSVPCFARIRSYTKKLWIGMFIIAPRSLRSSRSASLSRQALGQMVVPAFIAAVKAEPPAVVRDARFGLVVESFLRAADKDSVARQRAQRLLERHRSPPAPAASASSASWGFTSHRGFRLDGMKLIAFRYRT